MEDKENYREIEELDALFGVGYQIWDTKHLLEHWEPSRYVFDLLSEWYNEEYYFPDTEDKLKKMERQSEEPFTGKEYIDYVTEEGIPLMYMEWELPEDLEDHECEEQRDED